MNAIFLTQGKGLELFYQVMLAMKESMTLEKTGFYLADSKFFRKFKEDYPEIETNLFYLLKEWEIIQDSKGIKPDISLLECYEKEIGQPFLWNALVGDRRIYFGRKYAYAQDYKPRYKHEEMLSILQIGLKRMEGFFNKVKPDFVVFFQCNTLGEHLAFLFAQKRGIKIMNLRPTRIKNYFYAGENILEPSERLEKAYKSYIENGIDPSLKSEVVNYLKEMRSSHAMYEGVAPPSNRPPVSANLNRKLTSRLLNIKILAEFLVGEYKYRFGEFKMDNHVSGSLGPYIGQRVIRPLRSWKMDRTFRKLYIRPDDLFGLNYAFFPLHPEPEVTVIVYSKPFLNQIEAVRLISHNLPVGMKLIVKEHPWQIGKRPSSYYHKLLEIPNVMLAHPAIKSREMISNAKLITVISGSIGLEALMIKVPVVVLGRSPFNFLPQSMIRYVTNADLLGNNIRELLENYDYDERAMQCYIAAVMKNSVPVDFYSRLLGRKGAYNPDYVSDSQHDQEKEKKRQIELLARYLECRFHKFEKQTIMS